MNAFHLKPVNFRQGLKGVALILFIVTPGSMLLLPLLAWRMARNASRRAATRSTVAN